MAFQVFTCIFFLFFLSYTTLAHQSESSDQISSPLGFLNQLNGLQKGDRRKGVDELKKHLSYLGYLNHNTYSDDQKLENEDIFDGSLKLALEKYQEFYNLNVAGTLDTSTIAKMCEPRCGLPDFFNPNKSVIPFHMTSHYSFFPGHPRWHKRRLRYAFNRNVREDAKLPFENALKLWASSTPFRFSRVSSLREADIKISFMRGHHGDGHPFGTEEGGLAHTFAPPDGRVHLDADQHWSTKGDGNAYDIQTVGLHELGHALGLGHSRIKEAVMYPLVYAGERKGLHEDDIKGVKRLYNFLKN